MEERQRAPFGSWPSPFVAAEVAAGKVSRSALQIAGGAAVWLEGRPEEGGRQVLVRSGPDGVLVDWSPPGVSIRSRVHEYGGGAVTVSDRTVVYVDQADQRLYRWMGPDGGPPEPLTPGGPEADGARYADGRWTADRGWFVCVEERTADRSGRRLVAVPADGPPQVVMLVGEQDFVAAPRPSPDGRHLAWVGWDHPDMPWDASTLWVGRLESTGGVPRVVGAERVAGGHGVSVGQPLWCRDGGLVLVSDQSGWWQPYRLPPGALDVPDGALVRLCALEAEFHAPDWALGQATMAELPDGSLACRARVDGRDTVVVVPVGQAASDHPPRVVPQPCVTISGLAAGPLGDRMALVVLGSTPDAPPAVSAADAAAITDPTAPAGGRPGWERLSAPSSAPPDGDVSRAAPVVARTAEGPVHGLVYLPTSSRWTGPAGALPPLVVFCHGGPTGAVEPGFDPLVQFFTSRGLAVAAVDYRGSSGYGRRYREGLRGRWGVGDVDDCVAFAVALADRGVVDGGRMAIRGTSSGGLTALAALMRSDRFAGAVAWYGVTDLEALARDTHEFESRYLDSLVGPLPAAAATYRERSPMHHPDRLSGAVLLLQGLDDPVVPAAQSAEFARALEAAGVRCRYRAFAGESHGFRRSETIRAALEEELAFYGDILGFEASPGR